MWPVKGMPASLMTLFCTGAVTMASNSPDTSRRRWRGRAGSGRSASWRRSSLPATLGFASGTCRTVRRAGECAVPARREGRTRAGKRWISAPPRVQRAAPDLQDRRAHSLALHRRQQRQRSGPTPAGSPEVRATRGTLAFGIIVTRHRLRRAGRAGRGERVELVLHVRLVAQAAHPQLRLFVGVAGADRLGGVAALELIRVVELAAAESTCTMCQPNCVRKGWLISSSFSFASSSSNSGTKVPGLIQPRSPPSAAEPGSSEVVLARPAKSSPLSTMRSRIAVSFCFTVASSCSSLGFIRMCRA